MIVEFRRDLVPAWEWRRRALALEKQLEQANRLLAHFMARETEHERQADEAVEIVL